MFFFCKGFGKLNCRIYFMSLQGIVMLWKIKIQAKQFVTFEWSIDDSFENGLNKSDGNIKALEKYGKKKWQIMEFVTGVKAEIEEENYSKKSFKRLSNTHPCCKYWCKEKSPPNENDLKFK